MAKDEKKEFLARDMDIARSKDMKIYLPEKMEIDEAVTWLQRKKKEQEQTIAFHEKVHAFPPDGAAALMRAMKDQFGWTSMRATKSFFGDNPPTMLDVEINYGESIKVPWGKFEIPGVEGFVQTGTTMHDGQMIFLLTGEVKQKHFHKIAQLAEKTREEVENNSIYSGRAFRIEYEPDGDGEFGAMNTPKFLDLSEVDPGELIFKRELEQAVKDYVFTPILHPERCVEAGVPVKRGICLLGPYGTGKTLTAYVAAKHCESVGRTFIYLADVRYLAEALQFARQYAPAVVFAEDIDRVASGDRSSKMDQVLNTLDGVDSKESEVMVILTTNHIDRVNRAMLRPGRIDVALEIGPPDADAAARLVKQYSRGLLKEGEDLSKVGRSLEGLIPATIREAVERAKLSAISREDEKLELTADDLNLAAKTLAAHEALRSEEQTHRNTAHELGEVLGRGLARGVAQSRREGLLDDGELAEVSKEINTPKRIAAQ